MMSVTHAAIASCATAIALGTADPYVLITAAIGSQLPDLDSTQSIMGRVVYPVASWLEKRYPHRGPTHSFVSTAITAIVFLPVFYYFGWHYWLAIVLGQFTGWFSDCFTKSGVQAFWPQEVWLVIPGNPKARLDTRSPAEYWVLATAIVLLMISVNISSAGGVTETFSRLVFQNAQTAAEAFQKEGSSHYVYVQVDGTNSLGERINDRFEVLDAVGTSIVVEKEGRIYKVGTGSDAQIYGLSVKVEIGPELSLTSYPSNPQEMPMEDWLATIPGNAYLSGSLLLDDASEIRITPPVDTYPTVQATAGGVSLSHAKAQEVYGAVGDFWILSGQVVVRLRS